jgi:thiol-disulfide isomerase/thioredoxin
MSSARQSRATLHATLGLAAVLLAGCASVRHLRAPPPDARQQVLSVRAVRNGDVLAKGAELLEDQDGVFRAEADLVRAEIKLWTKPDVAPEPLARLLAERQIDAVAGAGQGSYLPPPGYLPTADARILTATGEDVDDLAPHAVAGKVTVFDFYADWCGPCRMLDRQLREITSTRADVAVRKLNIVDFNSTLAAHWVRVAIPMLVVYNRAGRKIAELRGSDPRAIVIALGQATRSQE